MSRRNTLMTKELKGVLLCGGEGKRLRPITEVVNKHLVRVDNFLMAEWPLRKMIECGITSVMIVTGGENFAAVVKYFGSGKRWGINIVYSIQDEPGGIAQALSLAEEFVGESRVLVCLGDNLWSMNIYNRVMDFMDSPDGSAGLFIIESTSPERFGVIEWKDGQPVNIIEKPKEFVSSWVVTGIYLYGAKVFEVIKTLRPSERNELEITDVNRFYLKAGKARITNMSGWWSDCGTMDTLIKTEELIKNDRLISSLRPKRSH